MKYKFQTFISFQKADPAGILYFSEVYPYAHQAFEHFINHVNIGWDNWFKNEQLAFPIVHSECDYIHPIFPGKTYSIILYVSKMSDSSLTTNSVFYSDENTKCSHVRLVHVCVDKANLNKTIFPRKYKDKLNAYFIQS